MHPGYLWEPYQNAFGTTALANMATSSADNTPGGCVPASENADGDHYFCTADNSAGGALT